MATSDYVVQYHPEDCCQRGSDTPGRSLRGPKLAGSTLSLAGTLHIQVLCLAPMTRELELVVLSGVWGEAYPSLRPRGRATPENLGDGVLRGRCGKVFWPENT